jgi:hypothetical protein
MPDDVEAENGGGRPKTEEDDVFIEAVGELGTPSTREVRDYVEKETDWGLSKTTALRRLDDLAAEGKVVKHLSGRGAEWMTPEVFDTLHGDSRFIDAIEELGGLQTTKEISEKTGFDETATLDRLQSLEREGKVTSRNKDGDGDTLWTVLD